MVAPAVVVRSIKPTAWAVLVLALALPATVAAQTSLMPSPAKGRGEACVEPTEVMRRNHMEFILHQRDETVHRGIRTSKHSFKGCIDCHAVTNADGQLARFDEAEHFCAGCHTYAAVTIDCFDCHADRPAPSASDAMQGSTPRVSLIAQTADLFDHRQTWPATAELAQ